MNNYIESYGKCRHCSHLYKHVRIHCQRPNHLLHLILTFITGFWVFIWIWLCLEHKWQCSICGRRVFKFSFGNLILNTIRLIIVFMILCVLFHAYNYNTQ